MKKAFLCLGAAVLLCFNGITQWGLTGNAGTTSANFIGTTDNAPLRFKQNSRFAGIIDSAAGETYFGYGAGNARTGASLSNTGYGFKALNKNTSGSGNTALGNFAMENNTIGVENTAFGTSALRFNFSGGNNTAIGRTALFANTASNNTAVGGRAMQNTNTGGDNTAVGAAALQNNTSGSANVSVGLNAMRNNTVGSYNIAIGRAALQNGTTPPSASVSIGSSSGSVAIGDSTLYQDVSYGDNVAIGQLALQKNTSGYYNIAIGGFALKNNTEGGRNTAVGRMALYSLSLGSTGNTAVGNTAMEGYNNGNFSSAFGYGALGIFKNGGGNTALGSQAMNQGHTGSNNTAVGVSTLAANISNRSININGNVAVGAKALSETEGNNNTAVGYDEYTTPGVMSNTTTLGYWVHATASNQVRIGNGYVTSIGGYVGWSNLSDGRFKKNVTADVPGIAFIEKLQPVTYTLDLAALNRKLYPGIENIKSAWEGEKEKARLEKEKIVYTGFVAQEVEKAAKETGFNFSGVDAPKNETDLYGLRYAEFVVPLVKAVQEQQQQIEVLNKKIDGQKKINEELLKRLQVLEKNQLVNL
jgi:trimeric autotransporter adhesin